VLSGLDLALVAQATERAATGVDGGLMDQLAAVFGRCDHALLIDCRTNACDPVALPPDLAVLVVHSGVPRTLRDTPYASRRTECEAIASRLGVASLRDVALDEVRDEPRARHVVTENERVLAMAAALRTGDAGALGPLLLASHASLRDDFGASTPELDCLVALLVEAGALGARLTGAGFGGCVVALVPAPAAAAVARDVEHAYRERTNLEPTSFVVHAVDGAGPVP
jgi:galactokinase